MNQWELKRKFDLDFIKAMIEYGESKNKDHESEEYKKAMWDWVHFEYDSFKKSWEDKNGKLEDKYDR